MFPSKHLVSFPFTLLGAEQKSVFVWKVWECSSFPPVSSQCVCFSGCLPEWSEVCASRGPSVHFIRLVSANFPYFPVGGSLAEVKAHHVERGDQRGSQCRNLENQEAHQEPGNGERVSRSSDDCSTLRRDVTHFAVKPAWNNFKTSWKHA